MAKFDLEQSGLDKFITDYKIELIDGTKNNGLLVHVKGRISKLGDLHINRIEKKEYSGSNCYKLQLFNSSYFTDDIWNYFNMNIDKFIQYYDRTFYSYHHPKLINNHIFNYNLQRVDIKHEIIDTSIEGSEGAANILNQNHDKEGVDYIYNVEFDVWLNVLLHIKSSSVEWNIITKNKDSNLTMNTLTKSVSKK